MAHMAFDPTLLSAPPPAPEKPARPVNISVGGNVSGQIVVGDKNVVIGYVEHGAQVTVIPPGEQPATRPRPTPVLLRPRPFPALLDRVADARTVASALEMAMPVEVHGQQGIGKTSLLRHLAQRPLETAYPDGVLWFEVRRQPVDDLLQSVYDAFYESDARFKPTPTQIRHALQFKRALIFLDDVELEREDLEALMDAAPGCTFALASSRRRLWGEGRSVALRGLPLADAQALVEQELGRPLTGEEQTAFQDLHAGLEGHPLSLIQAAGLAREGDISLVELGRRVKSDTRGKALLLGLLASLSKAEGRVLLAVAALDGAPLHADHIAGLTGLSSAGDILESLRERGLAQAHGARRYTLAGILGVSLQGSADISWWTKRALAYFVEWAAGHASDLESLLADAEAILCVLKWAAEAGRWEDVARLARIMEGALALGKRWGAWAVVLRWLLQAARALGDRALEAYALHQNGALALALGEVASARTALIQALRLREAQGDQAGAAVTRHNLTGITGPAAPPTPGPTSGPPVPPASGLPLVKLGILCVATGAAMLSSPYFIPRWIRAEEPTAAPRPSPVWSGPPPLPLIDTPTPIPTWTQMPPPPPPVQTAQPPAPSAFPSPLPPPPTPVDTPTRSPTPWPCTGPPANWVIYAVRPGDTLYSLALEHETTVERIMCHNRLTEPILAGQLIYLPPAPTPTVPPEQPDLVVARLASSYEVHLPGQDIAAQLDLVVANRGAAPASGISVDVVIGRQENLGSGDYLVIGRGAIHGLAPGESVAVTLPSAVLPQWPAGAYYLGAIVDPLNEWVEVDENNNMAVFRIYLSPLPTYPDLAVAEFTGSPHVQPGEVVGDKLYLVARNQGQAEAGAFAVDFYITGDTYLDSGDTRIGGTDVAGLAPGQLSNRTYLLGMAIPVDWPAGPAYIAASLDTDNRQAEKDETNNLGFVAIDVVPPSLPDLYVYKFAGPRSARAGDDIAQHLHLSVSNQGKASAGSFTLNIVIGETVLNAYQGQRVMRSVQVDGVAPGQIVEVPLDGVVIPPDWSAGDASYLGVALDAFNEQAESDEENNTQQIPISVLSRLLPPAAPSGVNYDRSGCVIVYLSWQDNADNEEGFYVSRDGEVIATLKANQESYQDNLAPPGAHEYGVSAFNAGGQSKSATVEVPEDNCYLQ